MTSSDAAEIAAMVEQISELLEIVCEEASVDRPLGAGTVIWPDRDRPGEPSGLDSWASVELVGALEDALEIDVLEAVTDSVRTVDDLARLCVSLRLDAAAG
jgi:acyl carrier protein